jgi:nitrogen regulatory protein PII
MAKVPEDTEVVAEKKHENLLRRIHSEFPEPDRFVDPTTSAATKRAEAGKIIEGKIFVLSVRQSGRIGALK